MKLRISVTILSAFLIAFFSCLVSAASDIETTDTSSAVFDELTAFTWEGTDSIGHDLSMEFYPDGNGVTSMTYQGETQTADFTWNLIGTKVIVQSRSLGYLDYNNENGRSSLSLYSESGEIAFVLTHLEMDDSEEVIPEESEDIDEGIEIETEAEAEEFNMVRPEFDISDYLTIEDDEYLNMVIEVEAAQEVTEEEIDQEILNNLYNLDDYDDLILKKTEGTVEEGDTINIDYVGTIDGVEFDGGTAEGYELEIGSGMFIEGFEEGLIGEEIGSTVDLYLTFPEDYGDEELNGEDVEYTVTINYVVEIPEITDEIAEKASDGESTTVEDYRESIRSDLQSTYDGEYEYEIDQAIREKLMELYPIEAYPQEYVDYKAEQILFVVFKDIASLEETSVEEIIYQNYGMSLEDAMEQVILPWAKEGIAREILFGAIAQREGITVTDEELQKLIQEDADNSERDIDDYMKGYDIEDIRANVLNYKVIEWLRDRVTIEERDIQ